MSNRVLIVGGGPAGMMAAIAAARQGAAVTLLERNEKLGKKLYITGKGRCNVTNDCTVEDFLTQVPGNPRFLYSALYGFTPQDMMAFLEEAGCPVVVQRGQRVFPATEKASDVTRALARQMERAGVRVHLNSRVSRVLISQGRAVGLTLENGQEIEGDRVILATGGISYSVTGSTGDGFKMALEMGHEVTPLLPGLSALVTREQWPKELQGLSLKNVTVTLNQGKKKLYHCLGEMLFTHFGVSGPLILEMSSHMKAPLDAYKVTLDLKPGLTLEQLDARLLREFEAAPRKQLVNILPALLPGRMAQIFADLAGLDKTTPIHQITREQRMKLAETFKNLPLTIGDFAPMEQAIVTRGGVSVRQIDPGTMESKMVSGLYFAGEMVDVDAHTGGFNLQIAFATGHLAGQSAGMALEC
ncbi:MAG: NAD(P)/FAD-dependent oxidoreductase [Clostridia bacterium]|nr:NAD(P)/FAD-dependent oxidoreductase [Clostridia bacterium]